MTDAPELKPCPFCGADHLSLTLWGESSIGSFYRWVQCQECFGQGPSANSKSRNQDGDETDAAAVEKWNTRAHPDPAVFEQMREALRRIYQDEVPRNTTMMERLQNIDHIARAALKAAEEK